MLIIIWSQNKK